MVKIRLARIGKRNDPVYRVVVIDSQRRQKGKNLAVLGFWHPKANIKKIDKKALASWTAKGAQVSAAVTKLLK